MSKNGKSFLNNSELYKYQDMIELPHHVSKTHAHMPVEDRAAQFAPFAALTGHYEAVKETERLTKERHELDEYWQLDLDRRFREIRGVQGIQPEVSITYFVPDPHKEGGAYVTATGCVKKIDEYERTVILEDGTRIRMEDILDCEPLPKPTVLQQGIHKENP